MLDIGVAIADGRVSEYGQDVVVQVLEVREDCRPVPATFVIEGRELIQDPHDLGRAGRGPAAGPCRARLPEFEDRFTRLGVAGIGVGSVGFPGSFGLVDQPDRVVREPPGEGVVGAGITQFGNDLLAKCEEGVSVL